MQNSIAMFIPSVLDRKYPFWANLVQKIKVVSLRWNLVPRLIQICKIQWWCSIFLFYNRNSFFGQFGPVNQNCQFKLKLSTYANSNMQNSMVMIISSVLGWKYPFWVSLVEKVKIVSLSWNLVPRPIWIMYNSMAMFNFSVSNWKGVA